MPAETLVLLSLAVFLTAALYSSVGHGGASGYIAIMALAGLAPAEIRPAALVLNIVVAGYAAFSFIRAGRFEWRVFWPFAVTAVPAALIAGRIDVPEALYRPLLAAALAVAAARYVFWPKLDASAATRPPALALAMPTGMALGALAGITGIGGGVYLSPLLVFARWSTPQQAAGITSSFIVVNSAAGLAGRWSSMSALPAFLPYFIAAALAGALLGAGISLARFNHIDMLRALGVVLGVAALALVL